MDTEKIIKAVKILKKECKPNKRCDKCPINHLCHQVFDEAPSEWVIAEEG